MAHILPIRVYYEDTDAGGIVYHSNYLNFCERGRTECLRSAGFGNKSLMEREGILFVVRHIEADYLSPARLDDLLEVHTSIHAFKRASFIMDQSVWRGERKLFEMKVVLVCVNLDGKPVGVSETLKSGLAAYTEQVN